MSSSDIAIRVTDLCKSYQLYDAPRERLKQFVFPRLQRYLGRSPKNYYREFWALRHVSFEVERGETVGIVGRNGSGKSTLLQIICGVLGPTSGTIEANGRIAALLELGAGFNPDFTGRENVYINGAILGLSRDELDARFDTIAAFADIGQFIDQPVKTYSSGMVVRLAFAVAISVDPQILIVDEALSVGDELFQRKCFSRIETIKQAGATILFVSHSGPTVIELCNRAILIDEGEKLAVGPPKSIVGQYQKLLYAPNEKKSAIRAALLTSSLPSDPKEDASHLRAHGRAVKISSHADVNNEPVELFDPNLKPQSTLRYESRGAVIEDLEILTLSGERINCLASGRKYCYRYRVRFTQGATRVRFGMLIKSLSGLELGGAASVVPGDEAIPYVGPGTTMEITFRFTAHLNPATYFLNAGVLGLVDDTEVYLDRILDACMFRVLPEPRRIATGMVDFRVEPEIRHVTGTTRGD